MAIELTTEEQEQLADAMTAEVTRIGTLLSDYKSVRTNTRNQLVRTMADEGQRAFEKRLRELNALIAKLRPAKSPTPR
jgi:hypothetical protein